MLEGLNTDAQLDLMVMRLKMLHGQQEIVTPPPEELPPPDELTPDAPPKKRENLQHAARGWLTGLELMGRLHGALVDKLLDVAPQPEPVDDPAEQTMLQHLAGLQELLVRHPAAVQALFAALVAEGRQWAQTPAGQQQWAALAQSERVQRARVVWETTTLNTLEARPVGVLPSAYLEALLQASGQADVELLFAKLFRLPQSEA